MSIIGGSGLITGSNISYNLPLAFLTKLESIPVTTSNSTDSTSLSNGALTVSGGMGVAGNIKSNNLTTNGTVSIGGNLNTNTLTLNGPLTVKSIGVSNTSNLSSVSSSISNVGGNLSIGLTTSLVGSLITNGLYSSSGSPNGIITYILTSGQRGFITIRAYAFNQPSMMCIFFEWTSGLSYPSATIIAQSGNAAAGGFGLGSGGTQYLVPNLNGSSLTISHVNNPIMYYSITLL